MTTPTETLTIRLPETAARRLRRVAELARRSVDEVVAEALRSNLPPLLEDVPEAFRNDLAALETLSTEALRHQLHAQMEPEDLARYDELLEANAANTLDEAGKQELAKLRAEADRLMFCKAYAALLLKWRGERVPALTELEAHE